jgi:hypothetical protein
VAAAVAFSIVVVRSGMAGARSERDEWDGAGDALSRGTHGDATGGGYRCSIRGIGFLRREFRHTETVRLPTFPPGL